VSSSNENCRIDQLLLKQSDYPSGTILDRINSPIAEEPRESAGKSAYYRESWIGEMVVIYPSVVRAREIFESRQASIFDSSEVYGAWETPSSLNLDNLSADQYRISCGNVKSFGNRCFMIGRYEEYFVLFRADISSNGITYEIFRDLILKINEQIDSCSSQ
jgi:hypothetical protein